MTPTSLGASAGYIEKTGKCNGMPELPEVETLRRGLERSLAGQKIVGVRVSVPQMLKGTVSDPKVLAGSLLAKMSPGADARVVLPAVADHELDRLATSCERGR